MTSDLAYAYQGVYNSSKEIIKNRQRHLYTNMLNLLTRTTRAAGTSVSNLINDDSLKFWYNDILPLVFDNDNNIQESAVVAMETALPYFDAYRFQNLPEWPGIKTTIVEIYSQNLQTLREASNSNWYKIWCLLIRILNKEILKGATVINTFLSIVELGFRSNDYKVRSEAFICWKVLVEIFANNGEIFSPKRIKLICIPLKSSQSKTVETAVNKLKVWWYFICKLNTKVEQYLDTILQPFLIFCFGSIDKNNIQSSAQIKMYPNVKQMGIFCLIELLGPVNNEVKSLMDSMELEHSIVNIINPAVMLKCGEIIIAACIESLEMIDDQNEIFDNLFINLHSQIIGTYNFDLYMAFLKQINSVVHKCPGTNTPIRMSIMRIVEHIGLYKDFPFHPISNISSNYINLCETIKCITEIVSNKLLNFSPGIKTNILKNIFNLKRYQISKKYLDVCTILMKFIMNDCTSFTKEDICSIWIEITNYFIDNLKGNNLKFESDTNAEIINRWIFLPFLQKVELGKDLLQLWRNFVVVVAQTDERKNFIHYLSQELLKLYENKECRNKFPDIIPYFIGVLDTNFDKSSAPTVAFKMINTILSEPAIKSQSNNQIIISLIAFIKKLGNSQIIEAYDDLKTLCSTIIKSEKHNCFEKRIGDDFKKVFLEKLKTIKSKEKNLYKDAKELMKNSDNLYVIIPKVWTLNPDKLTEHQMEKMREKRSDIPALYNDMSQSQDTSIKPWTPNKIVIAKGKDSEEIVIENKTTSHNLPKKSPPFESKKHFENINFQPIPTKTEESNLKAVHKNTENKKAKKTVNKYDEVILNKYNIQVEDKRKRQLLLKQLKSINIDTVEGHAVLPGKLRNRQITSKTDDEIEMKKRRNTPLSSPTSKRIRHSSKEHKTNDIKDIQINANKIKRKSLNFEDSKSNEEHKRDANHNAVQENYLCQPFDKKVESHEKNDSMDELVESSQASVSVLSKKVNLRKATNMNNQHSSPVKSNGLTENGVTTISENHDQVVHTENNSSINVSTNDSVKENENEVVNNASLESTKHQEVSFLRNGSQEICDMDTQPITQTFDNIATDPSTANSKDKTPLMEVCTSDSNNKDIPLSKSISIDNDNISMSTEQLSAFKENTPKVIDTKSNNTASIKSNRLDVENFLLPEKPISSISSKGIVDCSILSSPEASDADDRNTEFLNNTINISPILTEDKAPSPEGYCAKAQVTPGKKLKHAKQLSPPEKKLSIFDSPAGRLRPPVHLTGRGAQLINMIRNKQYESTPKPAIIKNMEDNENQKVEHQGQNISQSPPKKDQAVIPLVHKDLLVFSKILPSPNASPSASILKRKFICDNTDDSDSPANKRKRVSFHDPPVSVTKEYVKLVEEEKFSKPNLNRCLMPEKTSTPLNRIHSSLKRKNRVDSKNEIANFTEPIEINTNFGENVSNGIGNNSTEMDSIKWDASTDSQINLDKDSMIKNSSICFPDEISVLNHVLDKYSFEDIVHKYIEKSGGIPNKPARTLIKEISSTMENDVKVKANVLELLCEKHPSDFLQHAIQENLCSVVCDRLNLTNVVEFVCDKSLTQNEVRNKLLNHLKLLLTTEKFKESNNEVLHFLLENHNMNSDQILSCIEILIHRGKAMKNNEC